MKPRVLGFSGRIASGKSTVAKIVSDNLHIPCVSFGDCCRDVARYMGLDPDDREVLQDIGNLFVKHPREFCTKVLEQVRYRPGQSLVVEGIRHREIVDELRVQVFPAELTLVHVAADEETIESRLYQEGNTDQDIHRLEQDPTEAQVTSTLPGLADLIVSNDGVRSPEDILNDVLWWLKQHSQNGAVRTSKEDVTMSREHFERLKEKTEQAKDDLRVHEENTLTQGVMRLAEQGGAFDWLNDEEDLYTEDDLKVRFR